LTRTPSWLFFAALFLRRTSTLWPVPLFGYVGGFCSENPAARRWRMSDNSLAKMVVSWSVTGMSISLLDVFGLCGHCGDRPARIDGSWCSARCRLHGEHELKTAPSETDIRERCEEIQAGWNEPTRRTRQFEATQEEIDELTAVNVQVVREADMRQ